MNKVYVVFAAVIILAIAGFAFYGLNAPFTLDEVVIPESIEGYSKHNSEIMSGFYVTGGGEEFIDKCHYTTYEPEEGLNNVYACSPKISPEEALNSWTDSLKNFFNESGQGFIEGAFTVEGVKVNTITLFEANCGNPGYCTSYFWKQGNIIFKSDTKALAEEYIKANKGPF